MSETLPNHIAGIIPAAGASRRMGRHKATLPLEGRSFLARAVGALRDGGCSPVFVVLASGDAEGAEEAERTGAVVLTNPEPGEGPITSLRLAIARVRDRPDIDGVAYLPVDHPLVQPGTVAELLSAVRASGAPVTLPVHHGKRGHPAVFSRSLFSELTDPALAGGARTVVHRHLPDAHLLTVADAGVVADIDTPEAYEAIQEAGR